MTCVLAGSSTDFPRAPPKFSVVEAKSPSCAWTRAREECPRYGLGTVRLKIHNAKPVRIVCSTRESHGNGHVRSHTDRTAIVWFKRDLRVDDHPGLHAATTYSSVVPLFVFDPAILSGLPVGLVEHLKDAVRDLQKSLQALGSDLVIRTGSSADVIQDIANKVGAVDVITESELEVVLHRLVGVVSASLSMSAISGQDARTKLWGNSLYGVQNYEDLPDNYKIFRASKLPYSKPLDPVLRLPLLPRKLLSEHLSSLNEFCEASTSVKPSAQVLDEFRVSQSISAEEALGNKVKNRTRKSSGSVHQPAYTGVFGELLAWRDKYITANPHEALNGLKEREAIEAEALEFVMEGGASGALDSLQGYLRFQEPTDKEKWQTLHEHVLDLEKRPGCSFRSIFGGSLALGTLSLRRIYHEAVEYEKARGGGWLSPFGYSSVTAAAAIEDVLAMEWYRLLALKSREEGRQRGFQVGTWRWRGYLVQYAHAGETGTPVVFVHGFGAFWNHFRDNIKAVAEAGERVWALTLLGFGRSEKPKLTYSDLIWAELVRDFVVEVVGEPCVLAGNSIGGYAVSVVAGLWPAVVKSLVLFNSAGRVVPDYKSIQYVQPKEKSNLGFVGARALLLYLQNFSNGLLTKCYPTNPGRADSWLRGELLRTSYDPNSTAVLEAMFLLRAPLPLNYYLDRYPGNVLVVQGMRDPLHNSSLRASMLQVYCKNVFIQYVNAGHCPHDEVPDEVNKIVLAWLDDSSSTSSSLSSSYQERQKWGPNGAMTAKFKEEIETLINQSSIDPVTRLVEEVEELV